MKIAIVGTRGIPNRYGGFEYLAEQLSVRLVEKGFIVTVYAPHYRKDVTDLWYGVKIVKFYLNESIKLSSFIYDFLSLRHALHNSDIILVCGYVTSLPTLFLYRKYNQKIILHLDGLEWKRRKWNYFYRLMIRLFEKWAVRCTKSILVDHAEMKKYLKEIYNREVFCIGYGKNERGLKSVELPSKPYFLAIARNEKENNLNLIINAFIKANVDNFLVIFTNKSLQVKNDKVIEFINIYDEEILNVYRKNAYAYIHAYTVGGTNPTLIDAMGYCSTILALDNNFHREILGNAAYYFNSEDELKQIFKESTLQSLKDFSPIYSKLIKEKYLWNNIVNLYVDLFYEVKNRNDNKQ